MDYPVAPLTLYLHLFRKRTVENKLHQRFTG